MVFAKTLYVARLSCVVFFNEIVTLFSIIFNV
jgi:hypothetical protein